MKYYIHRVNTCVHAQVDVPWYVYTHTDKSEDVLE